MNILLLEDDLVLSAELKKFLEAYECNCKQVYDGDLFLREVRNQAYDIFLLDINVPKINGLDVCETVRSTDKQTPIIMLSAYGEISDKKDAYLRLADDYLVKPFQFEELWLRINALYRRKDKTQIHFSQYLIIEDLKIFTREQKLYRGQKQIKLTLKEYQLLLLLAKSPGKVFSKQQISEQVWDIKFTTNTNTIEVYMNFLRKKIDRDFPVKLLHTRSGFGYYLKAEK